MASAQVLPPYDRASETPAGETSRSLTAASISPPTYTATPPPAYSRGGAGSNSESRAPQEFSTSPSSASASATPAILPNANANANANVNATRPKPNKLRRKVKPRSSASQTTPSSTSTDKSNFAKAAWTKIQTKLSNADRVFGVGASDSRSRTERLVEQLEFVGYVLVAGAICALFMVAMVSILVVI